MARSKAQDPTGEPAVLTEASPAPQYVVQGDLLHDGTPYTPGETVPGALFTDTQIAHLNACGTLVPLA